jgi:tetratricopeptide (TPR) repeat protein
MKKVIVVYALIMVSVSVTCAQKQTKPAQNKTQADVQKPAETKPAPGSPLGDHFGRKYAIAARWNDFDVAKDAMYDLIVEYPGSDSLIFALAYYYYENQKYPSSILVCQDLLARNPKNVEAIELTGMGYESLSINDRALQSFESLFLITNNNATLYKMSFLQYQLKRYTESMTNVDFLLTKPEADSLKITYNDATNIPKEYPMKVALLNLKGMIYKDQSDKVNAKKSFEEALKIAPDFELAKKNLAALK